MMQSNGRQSKRTALSLAGLVSVALTVSILSGCEGGAPTPPGVNPPGMPPGVGPKTVSKAPVRPVVPVNPAVPKPDGEKPDIEKPDAEKPEASEDITTVKSIEKNGKIIALAGEILGAKTNPFLNRLPKLVVAATTDPDANPEGGGDVPPAVVVDPFEGINLLGIVYSQSNPVALVSTGGDQAELTRKGDSLFLNGSQLVVKNITQDSIELQSSGPAKESRSFTLPSIIGISSNTASGGESNGGGDENRHNSRGSSGPKREGIVKLPGMSGGSGGHSHSAPSARPSNPMTSGGKTSKPTDIELKEL